MAYTIGRVTTDIGIVLFCRCVIDMYEVISRLWYLQLQEQQQQQLFILTFIICIRSASVAVSSGLLLTFHVVLCVILLLGCIELVCNILTTVDKYVRYYSIVFVLSLARIYANYSTVVYFYEITWLFLDFTKTCWNQWLFCKIGTVRMLAVR